MPTVNKTTSKITAAGHFQYTSRDYRVSVHSTRKPNGDLKLRSNPHTRIQSKLVSDKFDGKDSRSHPWGSGLLLPSLYPLEWGNLEARSYASFRRKLYSGSASLGVTLASYKQSREMIVKRFNTLRLYAGAMLGRTVIREAVRDMRGLKPKDMASIHLEVVFGWIPLLQDIHAAATTVIQEAPTVEWIKSSSKSNQHFTKFASASGAGRTSAEFNVTHSRGAAVTVSNPNVWLAERAGLLNPATVAWDIVPWSFVVNMFLNTGQLVGTLTDFAGLEMSNGWTTKKARGFCQWDIDPKQDDPKRFPGRRMYYTCNEKTTKTNAISAPPLVWKVPEANFGLAAIAASLFVQKFSPIVRLINPNHSPERR